MSVRRIGLFACVLIFVGGCEPSPFVYHDGVLYNFSDEGFLAPGLLQTVGVASIENAGDLPGASRALCVNAATRNARLRALRVVLHTRFRLPGVPGEQGSGRYGTLERDYPFPLSERDYVRGEIDFAPLLDRGYIALQDLRDSRECSVVYRLKGADLPGEIREVAVRFEPEGYRSRFRMPFQRRAPR